ncbi:zinc ABC transporter substrate-binding protein [Roseisalinus antarcticus]|uniref:zinc ABC transporter substrate-binding protein n=1 Tax=Roseisalinus antarcticus TaxID=254357 RepID=UPI001F1CB0E3|nr:zinc ABC transporter substrate-binding protein [Roseisalinus antarcticus]
MAADIAPVQGLVARVMGDLGSPALIVPPGASPHAYAMRPSEAAALEPARLVVEVGAGLTPWFADTVATLAPEAQLLTLMTVPGTRVLPSRADGVFAGAGGPGRDQAAQDAHGAHEDQEDHGAHEDQGDHGAHDAHAVTGDRDLHDHGPEDPHGWLDPANAAVWLGAIAEALAEIDPENAETYRANARAGQAEIADTVAEVRAMLAPVRGRGFVVFHDAYGYFEAAFDMPALAALAVSDAADPGAARIVAIRDALDGMQVDCVFTEPQFNTDLATAIFDGNVPTAILDPLGSAVPPGPSFYPEFLLNVGASMAGCLAR